MEGGEDDARRSSAGTSATTGYRRFEKELDVIVEKAQANGKIDDPVVRQGFARYYTKVQIMRINGLRSLSATLTARRTRASPRSAPPTRCSGARCTSEVMELAIDILGMDGDAHRHRPRRRGVVARRRRATSAAPAIRSARCCSAFFFSRSETIWGGTSQIQRNIVGERVLGLPKEPS